MSTSTSRPTAPATEAADRSRPASWWAVSQITTSGTLVWLAWIWAFAIVGSAVVLFLVARFGELDTSLFRQIGAGWQRWPIGIAGGVVSAWFVKVLVGHGVTRRVIGQSGVVLGLVVTVLGALWITVGYWAEERLFDRQGWRHALGNEDGPLVTAVGYGRILLVYLIVHAMYFAGGWLIGTAIARRSSLNGALAIVAAVGGVIAVEYLVAVGSGLSQFDFVERWNTVDLAVGAPLAVIVIAVVTAAAMRGMRTIDVP